MTGGSEAGGQVTGLLQAWSRGDTDALDQLAPLLQAELRILARRVLAGEQSGNDWQATELVHESYLRLIGWQKAVQSQNRAHFFATTATIMRRVLVDAARARKATKRRADVAPVSLQDSRQTASRSGSCVLFGQSASDWLLMLNQEHLIGILAAFVNHYNTHRPHRGLDLRPPQPPPSVRMSEPTLLDGRVQSRDRLGGLLREYVLAA